MTVLTHLIVSLCFVAPSTHFETTFKQQTDKFTEVFPKRRDIRVKILKKVVKLPNKEKEERLISWYPDGIYPVLTVKPGNDNGNEDEYDVLYPFIGKVARSDVYHVDELLKVSFANLPETDENEWTRLTIAAAYETKEEAKQAIEVLGTLSEKNGN